MGLYSKGRQDPSLTLKDKTKVDETDSYKHSSLLQ
jgi:hypothetical protein